MSRLLLLLGTLREMCSECSLVPCSLFPLLKGVTWERAQLGELSFSIALNFSQNFNKLLFQYYQFVQQYFTIVITSLPLSRTVLTKVKVHVSIMILHTTSLQDAL